MDIYIDESGSSIVSPAASPKVSCVAAVVLPCLEELRERRIER